MKKFFEIIGFIALACFSFFYTNKISTVIMVQDDLLKQIESLKEQSYIKPIDAYIENDKVVLMTIYWYIKRLNQIFQLKTIKINV